MTEIVMWALFLLSNSMGDHAASFPTIEECNEERAALVQQVEANSSQGEVVFVSQCTEVHLQMYGGKPKEG